MPTVLNSISSSVNKAHTLGLQKYSISVHDYSCVYNIEVVTIVCMQ